MPDGHPNLSWIYNILSQRFARSRILWMRWDDCVHEQLYGLFEKERTLYSV